VAPAQCLAIEDSASGIRSAHHAADAYIAAETVATLVRA
jgi:beta-phosphoglucomutase-like phosphatase (HAD superfamily)